MTALRRRLLLSASLALLGAGCATRSRPTGPDAPVPAGTPAQQWSGRVSLRLDGEPPSVTSGAFELTGSAAAGELRLLSPLGQMVARLQWAGDRAVLEQGGPSQTSAFPTLDALLAHTLGTPVPAAALFEWLAGRPATVAGWAADLSRHAQGRITAVRHDPAPRAELRLILDTP